MDVHTFLHDARRSCIKRRETECVGIIDIGNDDNSLCISRPFFFLLCCDSFSSRVWIFKSRGLLFLQVTSSLQQVTSS